MEKEKSPLIELLSFAAVAGNILFVLWILYNGINASFQGTLGEKMFYITIMGLLVINAFLLGGDIRKKESITIKGMKEEKTSLRELLSWAAITGNILFMLWMTYRRISEGFKGSIYQQISYIGLMGLLSVTIVLLYNRRK